MSYTAYCQIYLIIKLDRFKINQTESAGLCVHVFQDFAHKCVKIRFINVILESFENTEQKEKQSCNKDNIIYIGPVSVIAYI